MKKFITTLCFAITALTSPAQSPVSVHAKAGIGTSNFWGKRSGSDTKIAYKAEVGATYALNKTWVLQSALEFVSIGGKDEIKNVGNADISELYLQLPVMAFARLTLNKDYHISLGAGPYVAVGVGGKTSGEQYNYSSSAHQSGSYYFKLNTFGSMQDNNMGNKRFDAGISLRLMFEYHRFIIGAEAQVGLMTVNKQLSQMMGTSEYMPKNLASFFTLGCRFW